MHTPGPWEVKQGVDACGSRLLIQSGPKYVAHITLDEHYHRWEAGANARLIEKAPEMLAWLKDWYLSRVRYGDECTTCGRTLNESAVCDDDDCLYVQARALLREIEEG